MFPTKFWFIWPSGYRGEDSLEINQSETRHLVLIRLQTWLPQTILVSDWLISKKSPFLKPLCQMNRNLVGSFLGRSSIKIAQLRPLSALLLDEGLNSPCDKNASVALWKREPISDDYLQSMRKAVLSISGNVLQSRWRVYIYSGFPPLPLWMMMCMF
jgi:hypothetical protein